MERIAIFVVDLWKLENLQDVHCDDMGSWLSKGVYKSWVDVDETGFVSAYGQSKPKNVPDSNIHVFYVTRKYLMHKTSKDLKKIIVFLAGK